MATDNLGFPFDSINHDRTMSSASFRKLFRSFFTNGIFNTDDFYVTANNSMKLTVGTGNACINGAFYPVSDNVTLTIDSSSGTFDRYDAIAIEFNLTDRQFYIKVVKGGTDGKWPYPKRTDSIYQLFIAVIHVRKGITSLVQNDVSDTRGDSWYCGYVTSTGSQERFESELQELKTQINNIDNFNKWSAWKSCGKNGCGITLKYRYNEASKLIELNWDGTLTNTIVGNSIGFMWDGFPLDKAPKINLFIPVQTQSTDLTLRFYPKTNDMTANHWTLTSLHGNVSSAYVCGSFIYSYA